VLELCLADVAPVRGDAERVTELLRGDAVRVQERRDGWARIVTAYDYPGWVREEALARRGGDPVDEARAYLGAFLARRGPHSPRHATRGSGRRRRGVRTCGSTAQATPICAFPYLTSRDAHRRTG
jgi:hypothetical protein